MKQCPQCQHINPDHAHFCAGCGAELERQCHACGKLAPADAKFCPNCGAAIMTAPPVPWVERRFSPEVRAALYSAARGLGITLLLLAFVTAFLTPPPRVFDEVLLLIAGAGLMVIAEILKPGRKPKPPGGGRLEWPDEPPPDGLMLDVPQDEPNLERVRSRPGEPPASTQGPFLN